MSSNKHPYQDSDILIPDPSLNMFGSGRAIKVKEGEKTSESAYLGDEVEVYGQTPLLPPTYAYSDAAAGEAYSSPKAKNSTSIDTKDNINGGHEPPLDPENPNRRWQLSKCFSTNRRKAAQHILKLMTILVSLGFIVHAVKGIHHRNVCTPLPQ